jgi:hypothetical protein
MMFKINFDKNLFILDNESESLHKFGIIYYFLSKKC